jgi:hypothetical protein
MRKISSPLPLVNVIFLYNLKQQQLGAHADYLSLSSIMIINKPLESGV